MEASRSAIAVLERADDDLDLVGRAYDAVLARSFGSDELQPRDEYLRAVAGATVVVATERDDIVGAAVSETEPDEPVGLLSHLAVRPDVRAGGLGARLLATLQARWASGPPVVVGEVHDPRRWEERPDERPAARLRFYERHGARLLDAPWVQPRLWSGGRRVPDMLLLVMGGDPTLTAVPTHWIRSWMLAYFAFSEGAGLDDATVAALVDRLGDDTVAIVPISDLERVAPLG